MSQRSVRILAVNGDSSLVEWLDSGRQRCTYVPTMLVDGGRCDIEALERGIPFGVDWAALIQPVTPNALHNALYRRGIRTVEDLQARFPEAKAAAWEAAAMDLPGLLARASKGGN